jgi:hypothetical protein
MNHQTDLFNQLASIIRPHTKEKTEEGTAHVQKNAVKFSNDCKKLMQFWQSGKWYWLSNEDGRMFHISSYLSARVWDLVRLGIPIERKADGNIKRFRLMCTCNDGSCWVHSSDKAI